MKLQAAARTDVGLLSDHNEDSFLARQDLALYLVADGVGGLEAGEMASKVACQLIEKSLREDLKLQPDVSRHDRLLAHAIRQANAGLYQFSQRQPTTQNGIGTTITALWFHGDRVLFASVGDSRIYLFRKGRLRRLSRDQKAGQYRLSASLGQARAPEIQLGMIRLQPRDRFLLCTDGLHGPVAEHDIATALDSHPDPRECCQRLIRSANDRGGPDNITALVVDALEVDPPQPWAFSRVKVEVTSPLAWLYRRSTRLAALLLVLLAAVGGSLTLLHQPQEEAQQHRSTVNVRLLAIAADANAKAKAGDRQAAIDALTALLHQAIGDAALIDRRELHLEPEALALWDDAAGAVWRELTAKWNAQLSLIAATEAEASIRADLSDASERLEQLHVQYRNCDYRHVRKTIEQINAKARHVVTTAKGDLERHTAGIRSGIAALRKDAAEFDADNPIRKAIERNVAAAVAALEAGRLTEATQHLDAAKQARDARER